MPIAVRERVFATFSPEGRMWKIVSIVALLLAASPPADAAQLELVRFRLGPAAAGAIIGGAAALGIIMMQGPRHGGARRAPQGKRPQQQHPGSPGSPGQAARSGSSHDPGGHQSASLAGPVPAPPAGADVPHGDGPPQADSAPDAVPAPAAGLPPDANPAARTSVAPAAAAPAAVPAAAPADASAPDAGEEPAAGPARPGQQAGCRNADGSDCSRPP